MLVDLNVAWRAYRQATQLKASSKVMLALFEAGLVESDFENLDYGDRDSVGFLQQRPSAGWGTVEQCMNPEYATTSFVRRAQSVEPLYSTAGKLAQAVQISAYPLRYDQHRDDALALIDKVDDLPMASAIATVLWPGIKEIWGDEVILSGITVNKGGYHSTRNWLIANRPDDYSIQLPIDRLGPGDTGSAIDVTFKSAQQGNYRTIAKASRLLYQAGVDKDPRTYPLREFQGNTDLDNEVEGWSYYRGYSLTSSDKSHLWHIHQSIHRKYINDADAMRSILAIWRGEPQEEDLPSPEDVWNADVIPEPRNYPEPDADNPTWLAKNALRKVLEAQYDQATRLTAIEDKLDQILLRP